MGLPGQSWWARQLVIEGPSMLPTLLPGEVVPAFRRWRRPRVGDVVGVRDPRDPARILVKRVTKVAASTVEVQGDNAEFSEDSRLFGPVSVRDVVWRVPPSALRR